MLNPSVKTALLTSFLLSATTSTVAEQVSLYYSDGSLYSGDLRLDENNEYELTMNGKRYAVDMDSVERCAGPGCPDLTQTTVILDKNLSADKTFGIYGSNTIGAELMPRLIEEYAFSNKITTNIAIGASPEESTIIGRNNQGSTDFSINLKAYGSGTSFPALMDGSADIGMASRPIKSKEAQKLQAAGINNMRNAGQEHVLALDGLVVIVAKSNPVSTLSMQQIAELFSGKITNWSEVGGEDQPVNIYARDNKSGTYDTFKSLVLKPNKLSLSNTAKRFESNEELSDSVAADAGAIGFTGFAYLRNAKALSLASSCGIVSEPTVFNVKTEEYPLARRLYLYTTGKPINQTATGLLNYALSEPAQTVISRVGFIDQSILGKSLDEQGQRATNAILQADANMDLIKDMLTLFRKAERLSTTFRFNTGSSTLDVKALQDIKRIGKLLSEKNTALSNRDVYLVGFSDSVGGFGNNLNLAKKRAQQVADELNEVIPSTVKNRLHVTGYGELSPVACNTNVAGQSKNRRVEIWVK